MQHSAIDWIHGENMAFNRPQKLLSRIEIPQKRHPIEFQTARFRYEITEISQNRDRTVFKMNHIAKLDSIEKNHRIQKDLNSLLE